MEVDGLVLPVFAIIVREQRGDASKPSARPLVLVKHIVLNPLMLSTLIGLAWAIAALPVPKLVAAYLNNER